MDKLKLLVAFMLVASVAIARPPTPVDPGEGGSSGSYTPAIEPILASFTGEPTSGALPLTVYFSDVSHGAAALSWSWDFGDGGTSTAQNPAHTYTSAGVYNVTMTATAEYSSDDIVRIGYITVTGTPYVSSVSGTIAHGEAVTLTGVSFGTKATAAPVVYDSFESGVFSNDWTMTGHPDDLMSIITGGANARAGATSKHVEADLDGVNISDQGFQDAAFACGSDAKYWFVQYWFKLGSDWDFGNTGESGANSNTSNLKFVRFTSTGGDNNSFFYSWSGWEGTTAKGDCPSAYSGVDWYSSGPSGNDTDDAQWHLFQFEYTDSDAYTANGSVKWWVDGTLVESRTGMRTSGGAQKRPAYIGFPNAWPSNTNGSNHVYMDDMYADNTFARVELGNSPVYNSCTHREIQVPTSWSNTSIVVTLNAGSFEPDDTPYLFVVDSTGKVSGGRQVTIVAP